MHTSRDELEPIALCEYEGRKLDAGEMRIAFESMPAQFPPDESPQTLEPVELMEISPVEEHDRTIATVAKNLGLVVS